MNPNFAWEPRSGEGTFHLEVYEDFFSNYWESDSDIHAFLSVCTDIGIEETDESIMFTKEREQNELVSFEEGREISETETPLFFRVNNPNRNVIWEEDPYEEGINSIGYISDSSIIDPLQVLFESTAEVELSSEDQEQLESILHQEYDNSEERE